MKNQPVKVQKPICKIQKESREDYLEAIYLLSKQIGAPFRGIRLAEFMGYSKASICRAMPILQEEGYVCLDEHSFISLTPLGTQYARQVYGKHCFFEQQLLAAGVDSATAHAEACRLEHAISNSSFEKLVKAFSGMKLAECEAY